jgi:DNA-binding HxlR family transcriptional regulator
VSRRAGRAAAIDSPLAAALAVVGDRWTPLLIEALMEGPRRFGDLQEAVPGIAPNVLTQRLRDLEGRALVVATPYTDRPPRYVYELTDASRDLAGALRLLAGWGARQSGAEAPHHQLCGTPLDARWWCPVCETTVDDADAADDGHWV